MWQSGGSTETVTATNPLEALRVGTGPPWNPDVVVATKLRTQPIPTLTPVPALISASRSPSVPSTKSVLIGPLPSIQHIQSVVATSAQSIASDLGSPISTAIRG